MKKVKIGVMGASRGDNMIDYCKIADNAEIVAICDNFVKLLDYEKGKGKGYNITFYDNFDEFIKHDMDAVILANFANDHAPYAIAAMKAGKHVLSEVLPVQTMKQAVELIETVEETGKIYAYGENFCFMPAAYEMKKLYAEGRIGEFEYGEGEYIHNCEGDWPSLSRGDESHWRNNYYATFYATHSTGPLVHITGLRPVSVTGFEGSRNERGLRKGSKGGLFGIEMITFENGGIAKSIHGELFQNSIWYSMYGSKGRMEAAREGSVKDHMWNVIIKNGIFDAEEWKYTDVPVEKYKVKLPNEKIAKQVISGHYGGDYYMLWHFMEKIKGNPEADTIDVYEAMDMFLPGMFAYRSILAGGIPMEIPNLRNKEERDKWRNDTACTDPKVAGDQLWPCYSKGNPEIDKSVYEFQKKLFDNISFESEEYENNKRFKV